jgi:hypothetical protein
MGKAANLVVRLSPTKGVWYKSEEKIFFWHQITFLECPALRQMHEPIVDGRSGFLCARTKRRQPAFLFNKVLAGLGWMGRRSQRPVIIYSLPLQKDLCT